jgi:hypothetical protein
LGYGTHPVVIVSHPARAANKDIIELLDCTSHRGGLSRPPHANEVILDAADGLNWATFCKCDLIYAVPRDDVKNRRGVVSIERRRIIISAIIQSHSWNS